LGYIIVRLSDWTKRATKQQIHNAFGFGLGNRVGNRVRVRARVEVRVRVMV
jgi:hypothetical protein